MSEWQEWFFGCPDCRKIKSNFVSQPGYSTLPKYMSNDPCIRLIIIFELDKIKARCSYPIFQGCAMALGYKENFQLSGWWWHFAQWQRMPAG
jgi:hypothetical protein